MRFRFTEEQRMLQSTMRAMLAKECTSADVKEAAKSDSGRSPERWARLAEMGVLGLAIPEAFGGSGLDEIDFVLVLEETGRALLPEPIVETAAVTAPLLRDAGRGDLAASWLPRIARGGAIVTIGLAGSPFVADAHMADLLLLERNGEVHAVAPNDASLRPQPSVDGCRRLFAVDWQPTASTLVASGGKAAELTAQAFDRGALAVAAQLVGVAHQLVVLSVTYAGQREQFGRPIGAFQAVKHLLANALLQVEYARPAVYRAAFSVAKSRASQGRDVSLAKAYASAAATLAARTALQVHGAIGYTEEHVVQLWMKRAWTLAAAWGTADWHRERIARQVVDAGAG